MSPIDLVYCWCDDADPKWRAKRIATAEKFGVATDSIHNGACRYRGGDMLRYSLRSRSRFSSKRSLRRKSGCSCEYAWPRQPPMKDGSPVSVSKSAYSADGSSN